MKRRGSVLVFTALILMVLAGLAAMTFDIGRMVVAKHRAQLICDSAAMAGAWYLTGEPSSTHVDNSTGLPAAGDGEAAKAAKYAALANNEATPSWATKTVGTSLPGATVTFPPYPAQNGYVTADNGRQVAVELGEAIKVEVVIDVPTTFGKLLGVGNAKVYASATAVVAASSAPPTPTTVTGSALPWVIADTTIWNVDQNPPTLKIDLGSQMTLKVTSPDDPEGFVGPGNFLAVSYPGDQGGSDYRDMIANASPPVTFQLNEELDLITEPGNMTGPTEQGLDARLGNDTYPYPSQNGTAWNSWLASYDPLTGHRTDTKRVGLVPVIRDPGGTLNGRTSLEVIGFVGVFIEGFETYAIGNKTYVRVVGRFMSGIYTANGVTWIDPYAPPYSSTVTRVRLLN